MAVPLVRESLERGVLDVAHPEAQNAEENATFRLGRDQFDQFVVLGDADIEIAVGGQDDAVRALLDEVAGGHVIGELDAGPAVGRAARAQLLDRRENLRLVQARGGREDQPRGAGVDDHRDLVVLAELLDQALQAPLHQRELVGLLHRAGDVDEEHEVAGGPAGLVDRLRGDPDPRQAVPGIPRAAGDLDMHGEGVRAGGGRRGVVIGEVVEQLLDADGVLRRQHVLGEVTADVGVAGRVHVDREGRERLGRRRAERVLRDCRVGVGVRPFSECCAIGIERFALPFAALRPGVHTGHSPHHAGSGLAWSPGQRSTHHLHVRHHAAADLGLGRLRLR